MAEENNFIMVYPQAEISPALGNPNGCFDFYGYTSPRDDPLMYLRKDGVQPRAVMRTLEKIQKGEVAFKPANFEDYSYHYEARDDL